MSRVMKQQIRSIVLGDERTYPRDLKIWMGTLGNVGEAPFYLTPEQTRWCVRTIVAARRRLGLISAHKIERHLLR